MNHTWKLGELPPTVELPLGYFQRRGIVLDCRGPLVISKLSVWGLGVIVLTRSHDTSVGPGPIGPVIDYGVAVDDYAWIGSRALLTGCYIGKGAIVAAGSVVRGQDVAEGVMVAGNPARVIALWDGQKWAYLPASKSGYSRRLG